MLSISDILQNRYEVTAVIKAGGMGAIYEVIDRRLGTRHALKEAFVTTREERAQFEQEARLLAQLSHPALPRVTDHFSERGGQFLVMELVPGDDLETLLEQHGQPFDVLTVLRWADQVLDALDYLHAHNPPIVHRDIKPANLKPLADARIKLLDFGIAKSGGQTMNAAKAYSMEYSPLEQFSMRTHTDLRSDLYALGATLYHMLTNHAPPSAPERAKGTPLPSPHRLNPACPPALAQVILRAMALKPEHRFPNAVAMRAPLQAVARSLQPVVTSRQRPRWGVRFAASFGGLALLAGLGLVELRPFWQPAPAPSVAEVAIPATDIPFATRATQFMPAAATQPSPLPPTAPPTIGVMNEPTAVPSPSAPTTAPAPAPTAPQEVSLLPLATASASSVLPAETLPTLGLVQYDPAKVLDGNPATSWVEGVAGPGLGEQLVLTFAQPVSITRIGVDVGFDREPKIFAANNRVRRATCRFSDGSTRTLEFQDHGGVQSLSLPATTTISLTIVIEAIYPGAKYDDTAIAEVEVWGYETR
ncbi:MAG TPA: protein kinase [Roseiflexaceae bacterium]|nr:protein kinase [Roseiflexaceae bacterium]